MDVILKALIERIEDLHEVGLNDADLESDSPTWQEIKHLLGFARGIETSIPSAAIDPEEPAELADCDAGPDLEDVLEIASFHGYDVHFVRSVSA